jgi:hypothetical protein
VRRSFAVKLANALAGRLTNFAVLPRRHFRRGRELVTANHVKYAKKGTEPINHKDHEEHSGLFAFSALNEINPMHFREDFSRSSFPSRVFRVFRG